MNVVAMYRCVYKAVATAAATFSTILATVHLCNNNNNAESTIKREQKIMSTLGLL